MRKTLAIGWVGLGVLAFSTSALAIPNFTPGDVSSLIGADVDALIRTAALGAGHRPLASARPLGLGLGLDLGVDVAVIATPDEFKSAIQKAANTTQEVPTYLLLPRFHLRKGLPMGIDIGASYISYQNTFQVYGADLQWAFLRKSAVAPFVAARVSYSYAKLYFMQSHVYNLDLVASKGLAIFDPYVGAGLQIWNGKIDVPTGGPQGLPQSVSAAANSTNPHIFAGLPMKLVFLKLDLIEIDYSFGGLTTYGTKVSLSF